MWTIKGNFDRTFQPARETTLNRTVDLKNSNINSIISEIDLSGYTDGDFFFRIQARNEPAYHQLLEAMGPRKFYDEDPFRRYVIIVTDDRSLIAYLLAKLLCIDSAINTVLEPILPILQIDFSRAYTDETLPGWLLRYDINRILPQGWGSERLAVYNNSNPSAIIKEVRVSVDSGGDYISIHAMTKDRENYEKLLQAIGPHLYYEQERSHDRISVKGNDRVLFASFLNKILEMYPDFKDASNQIAEGIQIDLSKVYTAEELAQFHVQPKNELLDLIRSAPTRGSYVGRVRVYNFMTSDSHAGDNRQVPVRRTVMQYSRRYNTVQSNSNNQVESLDGEKKGPGF